MIMLHFFKKHKKKILVFLLVFPLTGFAQSTYTLQKALQTARTNNPDLKIQQFNIGIAETDIITAKLRPNPVLNNQSLQLVQPARFPVNTEWHNGQNRQVWWQLTKSIQLPAQRRYKIDFAKQNSNLAQRTFNEIERILFQDVALKWLDVWTGRKQLEILEVSKRNADSLLTINRLRFKNQVITQTDLLRTELLANLYSIQIKSVEQNYKNEISNLKFLLGVQEEINIDTTDSFQFSFSPNIDSLVEKALVKRSDVLRLKSTIDVANSNIKRQKALAYPTPELGAIYNPQNTIPYLGFYGTLQIPVFSRNQGEIRKSYLLIQQAQQGLKTTALRIQTEISIAYNTYQIQSQNLSNFKEIILRSEQILSSVKYSYLRGGTHIVDFFEAQRSWLDTRQQYYETLKIYRQSYIDLLFVSGLINQMAQ
jgi:outer membrane protein, heavy metal efflux system